MVGDKSCSPYSVKSPIDSVLVLSVWSVIREWMILSHKVNRKGQKNQQLDLVEFPSDCPTRWEMFPKARSVACQPHSSWKSTGNECSSFMEEEASPQKPAPSMVPSAWTNSGDNWAEPISALEDSLFMFITPPTLSIFKKLSGKLCGSNAAMPQSKGE